MRSRICVLVIAAAGLLASCEKESAPARSAQANDVLYTVEPIVVSGKSGEDVEVPVVIRSNPGFKINKDFPWKIKVPSSEALLADSAELDASSIELGETQARGVVRVKPTAGTHQGKVIADFSICNDDVCKFYRDTEIAYTLKAE